MKDGALLTNAGHFWEEIDVAGLEALAVEQRQMRADVQGFQMPDGRWLHLLGHGNLVNIACADGHPAEVMDTSFALQALSARHLVEHHGILERTVHRVPEALDDRVAHLRLQAMGVAIDTLTPEQRDYLEAPE